MVHFEAAVKKMFWLLVPSNVSNPKMQPNSLLSQLLYFLPSVNHFEFQEQAKIKGMTDPFFTFTLKSSL